MPSPRSNSPVRIEIDEKHRCAEVRIVRPETDNLLDQATISALTGAFRQLSRHASLRTIVLSAEGDAFCSGIDLRWMQAGAEAEAADNRRAAATLATLFKTIYETPIPTIAKVQGDVVSAGLGLIAACDIAIASEAARFQTREVRAGILPALMSPYVIEAVGPRRAKYLFLTSRALCAQDALQAGLIHMACPRDELDLSVARCIDDIVEGSPTSLAATKALVFSVAHRPVTDAVVTETTTCIADFRASDLARAGIACALDGLPPPWMEDHESTR